MNRTMMLVFYIFVMNSLVVLALDPIGLRVSASLRGLPLGSASAVNNLRQNVDAGQFVSHIKTNYDLIVPENELKPQEIWKGDNVYDFTDGDWLIGSTPNSTGWIQQNGMRLRGHNLLWARDEVIPGWLIREESSITPDKAKSLLSDYIHTVVTRYRGKIEWWDVVNEAIDDQDNKNPLNLRDCFWLRKLGPDFMKYAFMFAHEADPDAQLYYNEYGIESIGRKANRTLALVNWLRSQGATVNGVGLQYHISVSDSVTPGDGHYHSAQQFIDNNFDIMVTELDIAIPMRDGKPVNPGDIEKQGVVYHELLQFALHFFPRCRAMLTWGFTDKYSWIPSFSHYTEGDALPLDSSYQPKPGYLQMQEELARVITDGVYCLSPQSQPDKYLGASDSNNLQLYSGGCNNANEKWNITWLGDGTYRLSPLSSTNRAIYIDNATAPVGEVRISDWADNADEEWVLTSQGNNMFRVGPRNAWSRVMTVYEMTHIDVVDYSSGSAQNWILTSA
jgi:endo-1,4-beta-xylanase